MKMKGVLILDNQSGLTETFCNMIKKDFHFSSIKAITDYDKKEKMMIDTEEPFYDKTFLCIVYASMFKGEDNLTKCIEQMNSNDKINYLIIFNDFDKFNEVVTRYIELNSIKQLSTYRPPDWLVIEHLINYTTKSFTKKGLDTLLINMRGQWKIFESYLQKIENRQDKIINEYIINELIPIKHNLNLDRITKGVMLGYLEKEDYKALYEFKYADKFLIESLLKNIDMSIELKKEFINGNLSYTNYKEFEFKFGKKVVQDYRIKFYLDNILTKQSLEYIYAIKYNIEDLKKSKRGFLKLLLKLEVI